MRRRRVAILAAVLAGATASLCAGTPARERIVSLRPAARRRVRPRASSRRPATGSSPRRRTACSPTRWRSRSTTSADELCGIRGMSIVDRQTTQPSGSCAHGAIHTAWEVTTGRPDVTIAVLDSGIEWNDAAAMNDLRAKVRLNQGELPAPRHDLTTSLVAGTRCASLRAATGGDHNPRGQLRRQPRRRVQRPRLRLRRAGRQGGDRRLCAPRPAPRAVRACSPRRISSSPSPTGATTTTTGSPTTSPAGTSSTTTTTRSTTCSTATAPARPATRLPRRTTAATSARARTAWCFRSASASRSSPTPTGSPRRRCTRPTAAPTSSRRRSGRSTRRGSPSRRSSTPTTTACP